MIRQKQVTSLRNRSKSKSKIKFILNLPNSSIVLLGLIVRQTESNRQYIRIPKMNRKIIMNINIPIGMVFRIDKKIKVVFDQ